MLLQTRELRIPLAGEQSPLVGPVNLQLAAGDRITLTGTSGSGKSTLLRCLAMLDARATGSIKFRGTEVRGNGVPQFRRNVAFIPQSPPRFALSVEESLQRAHSFAHCSRTYDNASVLSLLEELHLPRKLLTRPLSQVSGGEAQRLALIRALLLEPTVLLLDEVTSALDADSESYVIEALARWFKKGERAGIAVTHGAKVWAGQENRRIHIASGKLSEEGVE